MNLWSGKAPNNVGGRPVSLEIGLFGVLTDAIWIISPSVTSDVHEDHHDHRTYSDVVSSMQDISFETD